MTLGERICQYRVQRRLSQQEVAEQLEVSRQSVSKWETDGAVPELDKLVKLCELFEVSLDELVQGKTPEPRESADNPSPEVRIVHEKTPVRTIVGGILLGVGLLGSLIFLMFGGPVAALFPLPLAVCGVICLAVQQNTGLICGWLALAAAVIYLYMMGGVVIYSPYWLIGTIFGLVMGYEVPVQHIIGSIGFICFVVLLIVTIRRVVEAMRNKI